MSIFDNLLILTDSYKVSHHKQYPPGTEMVFSYFESRKGAKWPETVFFGLQYYLKKYLTGPVVTIEKIDEAHYHFKEHFGQELMDEEMWEYIACDLNGCLPIEIRAVPEGSVVGESNVLMTVVNTDPRCAPLVNYLETLLCKVWYPCTVATQSREMKKIILRALNDTGDPSLIDFKLHDFGDRGSTSVESAAIGGAAHLVNFKGTDTMIATVLAKKYYDEPMAGFSIPASEHSTITSWGKDNEHEAYENMLTQYPSGLVAVVSDSYDIFNAVRNIWGKELKDKVLNRNGCVVVRPDSGPPSVVVPLVLRDLKDAFESTEKNQKGYWRLPPQIRVIQGDGINIDSLQEILEAIRFAGFSADNVAFGSGGGLLQNVNRDTQRFAFKCSAVQIKGEDHPRRVSKNPATDHSKRSKDGFMTLVKGDNQVPKFSTAYVDSLDAIDDKYIHRSENAMKLVFQNGKLIYNQTFAEIRARAAL